MPGTPNTVSDAEYTVTGLLDECAIYDTALSPARVAEHYQLGASP